MGSRASSTHYAKIAIIIDASVALKWIIDGFDSDRAAAVLNTADLIAPHLIYSEIGNVVSKALRRGNLLSSEPSQFIANVGKLVTVVDEAPHLFLALNLSVTLRHSFYDCVYLAMAQSMGQVLLTADKQFVDKARAMDAAAPIMLLENFLVESV